ncbi:MAG: thioredoxin-disulfide reductase [Planctomycetota bacterium]|nr:thioredoxin-disulfide reductase [Planctomycetota bacterium]MDI6788251.1 thioredoxin-disulfide reductase [Planctomycetota bacterium]
MLYDIAIIGGGPAGLSAGIYASRALLKTLLLEKISPGGLVITTSKVENYPGFPDGISGYDLMQQMEKQARQFGLEILSEEVISITLHENKTAFHIKTRTNTYQSLSVIIATGTTYRKLGVEKEDMFLGRGISYCATCDGPLFRDKEVTVVGGGDSAVEESLFLTRFVRKVYLVHRRDRLRAGGILEARAKANPKIEFVWNSVITKISAGGGSDPTVAPSLTGSRQRDRGAFGGEGGTKIEKVILKNLIDNTERELKTDGIFVCIGFKPETAFLTQRWGAGVELDADGYIITDSQMRTSIEGIFAAGDVRSNTLRQIITACADGARAAVSAQHFVQEKRQESVKK